MPAVESPLAAEMTSSAITRACHYIEAEMPKRLPGTYRVTYMPRGDSFIIRWERPDGAKAEIDMDRAWMSTTGAPFANISVFLRHRLSVRR